MYWDEVKDRLNREVLDAEIEVSFKRRKYRGKQRSDTVILRFVALYDAEEGIYHTYVTKHSPRCTLRRGCCFTVPSAMGDRVGVQGTQKQICPGQSEDDEANHSPWIDMDIYSDPDC